MCTKSLFTCDFRCCMGPIMQRGHGPVRSAQLLLSVYHSLSWISWIGATPNAIDEVPSRNHGSSTAKLSMAPLEVNSRKPRTSSAHMEGRHRPRRGTSLSSINNHLLGVDWSYRSTNDNIRTYIKSLNPGTVWLGASNSNVPFLNSKIARYC